MPDTPEFWKTRGIPDEVYKGRGYVLWRDGDATPVQKAYREAGITGGPLGKVTTWARQETEKELPNGTKIIEPGSGLIIIRHAPPATR